MRDTTAATARRPSRRQPRRVDLRAIELDVTDEASVDAADRRVIAERGRIDVLVHNAGHMVLGPAEAFTPEQFAELYDVNVLCTQRVNRAALPHLRAQGSGLLVWVGSSSTAGRHPAVPRPVLRREGRDGLPRRHYAAELIRFGIDTTIVVPGSFTCGTNHFAHAGHPADAAAEAYDDEYAGLMDRSARARRARPAGRGRLRVVSTRSRDIVGLPRASGRTACTSTRPTTAPRPSTASATWFATALLPAHRPRRPPRPRPRRLTAP